MNSLWQRSSCKYWLNRDIHLYINYKSIVINVLISNGIMVFTISMKSDINPIHKIYREYYHTLHILGTGVAHRITRNVYVKAVNGETLIYRSTQREWSGTQDMQSMVRGSFWKFLDCLHKWSRRSNCITIYTYLKSWSFYLYIQPKIVEN